MKSLLLAVLALVMVGCVSSEKSVSAGSDSSGSMTVAGSGAVVEDELAKSLDRYAKATTYSADLTSTLTIVGRDPQVMRHKIKCKAPNKIWIDFEPFAKVDGGKSTGGAFVSDGTKYVEGAEDAALETVAPRSIADVADSFILGQTWSHVTFAPRLFAGAHRLGSIWKSPPMEAGVDKIGEISVKLYKFTGPSFYGTTEMAVDPKSGSVLRIRCKMEPLLQLLLTKLKGVEAIQFEQTFAKQVFNEPIADSEFKLPYKPKQISPEMTPTGWLAKGDVVPDFTYRDIAGKVVKLSSLRGKTVYLDFWATWCGPCKQTLPDTQALYAKYRNDPKVAIVALSNEKPETIKPFIDQNSYTFPVGVDAEQEGSLRLGITAFPTFVVIDRDGRLVGRVEGANTDGVRALLSQVGLSL